ncbi:hypothetical protein [Bacillus cereus]|uniref:hypothetical protein n=1 Tax=Bacillus cereus TaxID=1396 RepID=UPI0002791962|nr:hypothetical protein [Bacillus cereus]EJQ01757.1 hypothetical protein IE1_05599 [Bacillus cereus BAG3O-2]
MKKSLEEIYKKYPKVKESMNGTLCPLTNVEDTFYQLSLFINDPSLYSFNMNTLYTHLKDNDLLFALQTIIKFFQQDTNLISEKDILKISEEDLHKEKIYNQKMFSEYLTQSGVPYSQAKFHTYYKRGKIIDADIIIAETPYWFESSVIKFAKEEKNKATNKK